MVADDPIESFLAPLPVADIKPMAGALKSYGVHTSADLDDLAEMGKFWPEVEKYLYDHGLLPNHWVLIQNKLLQRRTV